MKVLLTGPFGTIGYQVLNELLKQGYEVRCFDLDNKINRKISKEFADRIEIVWGDITDAAGVAAAVKGVDAVIHNAAIIPPDSELRPELSRKVNVGGTENIVNAITAQDAKPLLVFPSSISVHGNVPAADHPIRKITDAFHAEDDYAGHKIECEKLIENSGIDWVIGRIGACLDGRTRKGGDDINEAMCMMFNIHIHAQVEWVHPKDVALAMVNAINNPPAVGKKFFWGGGESCRSHWWEFCNIGTAATGLGVFSKEAHGEDGYYTAWMDTAEAQKILQFQQHSLEDYRREMFDSNKWIRWLLKPISPLIKRYLTNMSPHINK